MHAYAIQTINNPWPTKNKIYWGSGKVRGTSGVTRALIPPPIPQKKETSKKILLFVNKKTPINIVDRLHIWMGINLAHGKSIA